MPYKFFCARVVVLEAQNDPCPMPLSPAFYDAIHSNSKYLDHNQSQEAGGGGYSTYVHKMVNNKFINIDQFTYSG